MIDYLPNKFPPIQVDGVRVEGVDKDRDIFKNKTIYLFTFENGLKIPIEISDRVLFRLDEIGGYDYIVDCLRKDFRREMTAIANDALDNGYVPSYWKGDNINKSYPVEFKLENEFLSTSSSEKATKRIKKIIGEYDPKQYLKDKSVTGVEETPISRFEDILKDD